MLLIMEDDYSQGFYLCDFKAVMVSVYRIHENFWGKGGFSVF